MNQCLLIADTADSSATLSFLFSIDLSNTTLMHLFWRTVGLCRLWLLFAGGESSEHPSILYQFDFGSLTNSSLRQIERELIEVSVVSLLWQSFHPLHHNISINSARKRRMLTSRKPSRSTMPWLSFLFQASPTQTSSSPSSISTFSVRPKTPGWM